MENPTTVLIEAPLPNSTFSKFKSQAVLPNVLLDLAPFVEFPLYLVDARRDHKFELPKADTFIVNIGECVEKTKPNKHIDRLMKQLSKAQLNGKKVMLTGWYPWINKHKSPYSDFRILHPKYYEMDYMGESLTLPPEEVSPSWHLVDISERPVLNGRIRATLRTSRGCPRMCKMCPVSIVHKGTIEVFPLRWVVKQIDTLYKLGYREINFLDDNFTHHPKRIKTLLQYLIDHKDRLKGMKYMFHEGMEVHNAIDIQLLRMLKNAGFFDIKVGIESLNKKTLEAIGKPYVDPWKAIRVLENFKKVGIKPTVFVLFGLPYETEESYRFLINTLSKYNIKVRAQILHNYDKPLEGEVVVPEKRQRELMRELEEKTGSVIWKRRK